MIRYKLIKLYPGSPDIDTVVYSPHREKSYPEDKYKTKNQGHIKNYIFYSKEYIENFPKFWKKLKNPSNY